MVPISPCLCVGLCQHACGQLWHGACNVWTDGRQQELVSEGAWPLPAFLLTGTLYYRDTSQAGLASCTSTATILMWPFIGL